ncbi:MAG: hypothetical protein EBT59_11660, partial [Betaproteobacteria bacterium]|nr:hypothetical protein [Betaproteobacteria bacterium]
VPWVPSVPLIHVNCFRDFKKPFVFIAGWVIPLKSLNGQDWSAKTSAIIAVDSSTVKFGKDN